MYQVYSNELYHHGIKGQKWGVRRFQNEDGSVTAAGAKRYYAHNGSEKYSKDGTSNSSSGGNSQDTKKKGLSDKQKTALKVAGAAVGTALAAYGGYKLAKFVKEKNIDLAKTRADIERKGYLDAHLLNFGDWDTERGLMTYRSRDGGDSVSFRLDDKSPDYHKQVKNMSETLASVNRHTNAVADATHNATMRDARFASLGTATRNVGSHYANRAKSSVETAASNAYSSVRNNRRVQQATNKAALAGLRVQNAAARAAGYVRDDWNAARPRRRR